MRTLSIFQIGALLNLLIIIVTAQEDDSTTSANNVNNLLKSVNIINCRSDNYQDKLYLIKLPQTDSWIMLIGSSIALFIQISFVLLTFKVPRLKAQPGDILLGAFCAESLLSIHWLMTSIEALIYPESQVHQEDAFCIINSIISILGTSLQGLYNFAFFLFIGFSIKNSLRASSISRKKTHFFTIGISIIFLCGVFFFNLNGKTLYGTCSYVSDESFPMASILLYFLFLCFAIIILIYFNHKIPNTTFYKKKREEFLSFSRLYLSFCLLMWGLIAISNTALFLNCQYFHTEELVYFQTIGNSSKVISSIILPLIRLKDPYLRSIIKQQKKLLKKKIIQTIPLLDSKTENGCNNSCAKINQSNSIEQKNSGGINNFKSSSQNSSFDYDRTMNFSQNSRNPSQKLENIQRLSQKYKDQRTKLSSFDDLKFSSSIIQLQKEGQGDQLSQQEIEARLSIFDNQIQHFPQNNRLSQKKQTQYNRSSRMPSYLPPIFSAPSNISNSSRKQSTAEELDQIQSIHQESFKDFQIQYSKVGLDQQNGTQQIMSLGIPSIFSQINSQQKEQLKGRTDSIYQQDTPQSFAQKEMPFFTQTTSIIQPPVINVIKAEDNPQSSEQIDSPAMNSQDQSMDISLNLKLAESTNNIRQRKKLSMFYKSNSLNKEKTHDSYLSFMEKSGDTSRVFLSRRRDFRKTLNQEISKKRLHSKLFDYLKKSSISSEMMETQYKEKKPDEEEIIFQEKLNEMIKNAHMMDYFNDPYYKFNQQSQSGSFTDIDQIFGNESSSSGSSIHQNPQLQAETIEGAKDHFIRILQRNIKMGVLSRILCGIQIHFMRKKRYCTKVDIFSDNYSSIFNCKINSVKLNKSYSTLSSQLPSIRPSRTGFYEQFQTQTEQQTQQQEKQQKITQDFQTINYCDTSKNEDLESSPPYQQVVCSTQIQQMQNSQIKQKQQFKQLDLEQISNQEKPQEMRGSVSLQQQSRIKGNSQQINLREVSLSLTRMASSSLTKSNLKNKKPDENEIFYEVKIFQFSDDSIKSNLQHAPSQLLDSDTFDLVRMRVYAPTVFHSLQQTEVFLVENQQEHDPYQTKNVIDIQKSFNIQHNMTQIKNASGSDGGKSGQFFFFSHDNKFLLKTINEKELKILLERLPSYFRYLKSNPRSLIAKIFGVYTFEGLNEGLIHLVLMKNIAACTKQFIERTYDLKGSKFDREVLPKTKKESESFSLSLNKMILKDIDFINLEKKFYISLEDRHKIFAQLRKDAEFLRSCGLIDYSLIVFKINRKRHTEWKETCQIAYLEEEEDLDSQLSDYYQFESSEQRGIYYHIGIIDYLQLYDMQKLLEKYAKRIIHFSPSLDTSSQDSETYSKRFINFMKQILDV